MVTFYIKGKNFPTGTKHWLAAWYAEGNVWATGWLTPGQVGIFTNVPRYGDFDFYCAADGTNIYMRLHCCPIAATNGETYIYDFGTEILTVEFPKYTIVEVAYA